MRLRIRVSQQGSVIVESHALEPPPTSRQLVALASSPIDRADRFLYHKTTARAVYERHMREHPDAFDALLWNEAGEITEFTRGNVIVEINSRKLTPPRSCGLLNGIFRNALVERGEVAEAVVTIDDLRKSTHVWFVNSLREWVDVTLGGESRRYT